MTFFCTTEKLEWQIQIRRGEVNEMERVIYGYPAIHTSFKTSPNKGEHRLTTPIKESVFKFFDDNAYDVVCNSLAECLRGTDKALMEQTITRCGDI